MVRGDHAFVVTLYRVGKANGDYALAGVFHHGVRLTESAVAYLARASAVVTAADHRQG